MNERRARTLLETEHARLLAIRDGLSSEGLVNGQLDSASELSSTDQHPADAGTETFEREKDFSIRDGLEIEMSGVERALRKLDGGTFGICEECGKKIPDARLEAVPGARFCVDDQAKVERASRAASPGPRKPSR